MFYAVEIVILLIVNMKIVQLVLRLNAFSYFNIFYSIEIIVVIIVLGPNYRFMRLTNYYKTSTAYIATQNNLKHISFAFFFRLDTIWLIKLCAKSPKPSNNTLSLFVATNEK